MTIKTYTKISQVGCPGGFASFHGPGNRTERGFCNDADRSDFLERLAVLVAEGALDIYAWVLMPNHFRLLCK